MLREFTVEQLIRLVDKLKLQMDAIFSSDLATSWNNKGYQQSFSDFVKSLMSAASKVPPSGPVNVDLMETAVNQFARLLIWGMTL